MTGSDAKRILAEVLKERCREYIPDIAVYGMEQGVPGFTYYADTVELYDAYHNEIWAVLREIADERGCMPMGVLTQSDYVVYNEVQLKNALVWIAFEEVARWLTRHHEEEDDDEA